MAERRNNGRKNGRAEELTAREAIVRVRRELPQLLGKPIESVLGVERDEDDSWQVTVQVVELSRIPSTTDVLGSYAVTLNGEGEVTGYRRKRRYHRNQTDED